MNAEKIQYKFRESSPLENMSVQESLSRQIMQPSPAHALKCRSNFAEYKTVLTVIVVGKIHGTVS